jgi:hypothetical protein
MRDESSTREAKQPRPDSIRSIRAPSCEATIAPPSVVGCDDESGSKACKEATLVELAKRER